ncbi:hypothetical protein [Burkholderia sp. Ac-20353]|uniref:hypothetical protein n=1 Tax=Burkholderia sp. Ac-20353 TaxID=2703894 RepID=UPI00197BA027|nr:hypothetical protein [Burkholderia sp. Ac-20353]MBN3785518.1 hypothetical protein [Burkholderia sp. Ac-20353]
MKHNPLFELFEFDGGKLCPRVTCGEISFNFANGPEMNAAALYPEKTVVVFRGMMEAIFKISARLVGRGAFPLIGSLPGQSWTPDYALLFRTPSETLASLEPFENDVGQFPWLLSPERLALFMFISNTMFRFIVFHELGHFFHEHGGPKQAEHVMDFDEMAAPSSLGDIDQQAKELLADTYAFQRLMHFQREHLLTPYADPVRTLLASHFAGSDEDLAIFVGTIVYIYFQMTEVPGDRERDPATWKHPPAPFRLKTIFATTLEYGVLDIPPNAVTRILQATILRSQALITTMLDQHATDEWLGSMSAPKFGVHYERLLEAMPLWCTKDADRWDETSSAASE